jgi:cobalt-zinc-cadmium efflux system outer membrane protein
VNLLQIETERLRQERIVIDVERQKVGSTLAELLGRSPDGSLAVTADLDASVSLRPRDELLAKALEKRADVRQRRLEAERGAAEETLAKAEKWGDWSAGLAYQRERQVFEPAGPGIPLGTARVQSDQFVGLKVTIPLPLWNRNQGRIAEARASQSRARSRLSASELKVKREVETAWFETNRVEQVVRSYRERIITLSDRNLKLVLRGYAEGLVGIAEVFQAQQQYATLRQAYYDALGELWRARIDLETASATNRLLPGEPGSAGSRP